MKKTNEFDDYCDLDPTKICDNCCKCIESGEEYAEYDLDLTDKIEELEEVVLPFDWQETDSECDDEVDAANVAPLDIDPKLMAEWEAKLRDYEEYEEEQREEGDKGEFGINVDVEL